ncbi:exodeoxyribonuclease V subunit gamma [Salinisphaera sp.]|uniref:exodeoxyribonuclease V subunit gamma n=1 Tax=Salinisphaera sp. TaxID=1914330 RepID=UPI000C42EEC3|nr:exodeoxyribonuclease V subunit gamma [Salinisphaera sp.]MAS10649.1 exodeoxyribonuclease V subunit gamma [Salinisphaera sp.]|tara:strand:- start:152 stop:3565 length:3414 start_codon:yes stop_codon:yes gene_type:complete
MFYLYHHNDLARLAELFGALRQPSPERPVSPLAVDTVLAPNPGIGRWLSIQLAESEGIAANLDIVLPGGWIWNLLRTVRDAEVPTGKHFEADCLPWHLYAALPAMATEIPAVADYLGDPVDEVRRYQLARQLADVFDKYLIYRADMLARWEDGETPADNPGRWQAQVWRWLTHESRLGRRHRARVLTDFITRLRDDKALQQRVVACCPEKLYCFGLVALAPDHLRLLYALAEHIDVHFLLPNPSEAYWGDVTTGRLALDLPTTEDGGTLLPGEAAVEAGHPLLGALGRMARDTLRVLYSDEFAGMIEPELGELMAYDIPGNDSLLHRIQTDIVQLDCSDPIQGMADNDTSLEVHACHSPLREIQVLQDQLLDRLAADDKRVAAGEINNKDRLAPRDIIVMLPDVAAYAPAIEAVFGGAPADRYLPFGLADRARSAAHPIVTCVSALLDLPLWRWEASALLDLLAVPAVMRRFGLSAGELDAITDWIDQAGIRWGRDKTHRAQLGAGAFEQNSWRFGLDRLLLGVAQSDEETLTDGVAPWADLEGGITAALGKLWRFENTLSKIADALAEAATPGDWQIRLNRMVDLLITPAMDAPDEQRAVDGLRSVFAQFEAAETCTSEAPLAEDRRISWPAVRDMLRSALDSASERQPFLAGGITFCGMVPLRAVPFRMVCVLGMNDDAFPRQDTGRAFNVMFNRPRLGDRNTRDDDRLLFLQALTAARDTFYISHVGQDVHTGEALPPSPIVGETLEFIHRHYFRDWSGKEFRRRLIHEQPMQPFSVRYFAPDEPDRRVFTFAGDWRDATKAAVSAREVRAPMLDNSVAPATEAIEAIDLDSLKRFFDHPPRAFFRERVKLNLDIEDHQVDDNEPIALNPLGSAGLRQRLFETADAAGDDEIELAPSALERARGTLPPPPLADPNYAAEAEAVNELLPIWQSWKKDGAPESVDIHLDDIAGVRVTGRVAQLWPGALRRLRTGKLKTRFRLRYWIDYLAVVATGHDVALEIAGFSAKPKDMSLAQYTGRIDRETARAELANLVTLYIDGQRQPLAYHPDLDDGYEPEQNKAFDNLSFRFKPEAYQPHHLMRDPYLVMLLDDAQAPLGEDAPNSPFIAAIDAVSGPMNRAIQPSDNPPETNTSESA